MRVDVVFLPSELKPGHIEGRVLVVLDVLRATTTIAAALEAGVQEVFVYPDIESVRQAKKLMPGALACGEQNCLKPEGFDLGNSPEAFGEQHRGRNLLMCTTNGTKAILAARGAVRIFTGAIVNGRAVGQKLLEVGKDVTLLCAGTNGEPAMEDVLGAGMIIHFLGEVEVSDSALMARQLFRTSRDDLVRQLRSTAGGQNIIRAKLEKDIDFAARMNIFTAVGEVKDGDPIRIVQAA
jgi:2-phosphosulfolactate phosphatase